MQILNDAMMADRLWYQIGGKVRHLITASNKDDITKALEFIAKNNIQKVFVCGLGANLIFTDDYFDGVVLQIATNENRLYNNVSLDKEVNSGHIQREDEQVTVFAGEILDNLLVYSLQHNLSGLEWAGGLPGTVGAGVRGNVGCFGGEIKDNLISVDVLLLDGDNFIPQTLTKEELQFSYRNSFIKQHRNYIVISALFQLTLAESQDLEKAKNTYLENINYRRSRHPLELPNCGSVFKNINQKDEVEKVLSVWPDVKEQVETKWHGKVAMGYIVRRLGLSAKRIGKAEISEKHSNFILNHGGAKASDVLGLISEIQNKCDETFGFRPEVEVEIIE